MMRYILPLFILIWVFTPIFSQSTTSTEKGVVQGVVFEESNKEPILSANIKLLNAGDSTLVKGTTTNAKGQFKLNTSQKRHILEISYIGYHKQYFSIEPTTNKSTIDLDSIYLKEDFIALQEAVVIAELPAMQVRGDTIEFNAGAYSSDGSSVLKDLIKQIPGLEIDNEGVLKANGKVISKILLDGKEYFGNDIGMALSTLPANMITKLQLFEKESEEAKASGIKDQDPEQVLNLQVKEEFKRSIFGDVKSGMGNKGRHTNRGNINKMHGDNQYSLVGDINNINDSEHRYSSDFDDNISKSLGANFNIQESEKITFNGNARYNNNKSQNESISDSYSSILNQYTNRSNRGISRRQDMGANLTMDWKPDSLTTIYLRTGFGYNTDKNISTSADSASIVDKSRTSSTTSRYSETDGFRINNSLMLSRKLNDKGRNITLSLSQNYSKNNSDGSNYSEKIYWENSLTDIIDQVSKNNSKNTSYGVSARYVEPLGKDNRIFASYSIVISNGEQIGDVRKVDPITGEHTLVDSAYSRNTNSYNVRQNARIGFQHTKEKYNFNINFSVDPSYTRNKIFLGSETLENLEQRVVNFSPSARFSWEINKSANLDFSYNGSTQHPYITQLSADTVIYSAMSKRVGNPNLKPSFTNRFGIDFRKSDFKSGRYFSASVHYSFINDHTVDFRLVDEHSNTINTYRNVDGNANGYGYITYNTPLKNKKINVGGTINANYNKNIGFINTKKNIQQRVSLSPSVFGQMNLKKVEARLNLNVSHSIVHNDLAEIKRSNNTNYMLSNSLKIKLPLDFSIESTLEFSYRSGLGKGVKKDETMWNLAASKLFLKDKRGILKVEFFDVLNDLRQQENTISGSDYSNNWRRQINNYFIVSFSYRFNIVGKGKN